MANTTDQMKTTTAATLGAAKIHRRELLLGAAAAGLVGVLKAPAALGQTKEFSGVTLNGAAFQHAFQAGIAELLPEFEKLTGIRVNLDIQAFPVYNQRMDLELSTKGSAYDFCNITFPYSGRWVGSKWLHPLDEFVKDPNATPPAWDADDFISGAQTALRDREGKTYGFAWVTGVQMMAAARGDLIEKAGMRLPTTFAELKAVCAATHQPGTAAYGNDKLHHWQWPPFLMGMGGKIFKDPSGDPTPDLNSPEAVEAAAYYAELLTRYGPPGVLSFTDDQVQRAQFAGRVNIRTQSLDWLLPLGKSPESQVRDSVRYGLFPGGSAGWFPAVNSQGYGIPAGAKNKRAAWELIKWAVSKENVKRMAFEKGQLSVARRSVLEDPQTREAMTVNGQDVAKLYLDTVEHAGKLGYMAYRILPVFPQVGEKINKAIERIASKQESAQAAMDAAQQEAIADLKKAGVL
ncbi:ABC transporter substrate-binding protein [Shumkonia mesophila]|uniref:ABC transporter substrate-binding protein n=1 Tax=Shumkonia mesophila TaxID=2838854 RepID=UPI002934EE98|nr:extracellular solute-binding protein [Shumkonia mesophila]